MSFKGQLQDFQVSFQVNSANVLEIQALNSKIHDHYSFAIDKDYLTHHSEFFNIIEEPSQLFQALKANFAQAKFELGQLTVPYGTAPNNTLISILLFRDPSYRMAIQNAKRIDQLAKQLQQALKEIERLRNEMNNINSQFPARWEGYFIQGTNKYIMTFQSFSIEAKPSGLIRGVGSDQFGSFQMSGTVGADSVTANFEKRYSETNVLFYFGKIINSSLIEGHWSVFNNPGAVSPNHTFQIRQIPRV